MGYKCCVFACKSNYQYLRKDTRETLINVTKSNQKLCIHTYKQVHSVYKSKVFKSIYIYTNTTIVDIMHSIYI